MIRALWFLLKVAVVVAIAVWLAERPGFVTVAWQGYVLETSFAMMVLIVAVALGAAALLYQLFRGTARAPGRIGRWSRARRRERGYRALTQGMVAVAAGDAPTARRMARRADVLLNEPPLTMLLSAQAAQLAGDDEAAKRYFTAMLERPETAFLGLRGLLTQALRADDRIEALALARKARELQPDAPWLLATLYDLEARQGEWTAAEGSLQRAVQQGAITPEDGRHHRAALLLERSLEASRQGRGDAALTLTQAAHDLLPGFVPAAVRLIRLLAAADQFGRVTKVANRVWRLHPHPELSAAYREALSAYDPLARLKSMQKLCGLAPNHAESHLAVAAASVEAKLWGEARSHLTKAVEMQPSRRAYARLAELERAEHGNEEAAAAWLAQAASAPPEPAWTCRTCATPAAEWSGTCHNCGAFDTLDWKAPSATLQLSVAPSSAASLPTVIEAAR